MKHKKLKLLLLVWTIILLTNYYWTPYFVLPFVWLLTVGALIIFILNQIFKFYNERKNISKARILNIVVLSLLLFLTFYRFYEIPNRGIEKIDWFVLKNKRTEILGRIKKGELKPDVKWNNGICELPFEFPIISNGGNDVWIFNSEKNSNQKTVKFFIFRNFFDSPSTYLIYSDDSEQMKYYEDKIKSNPKENWKIEQNWYRINGY